MDAVCIPPIEEHYQLVSPTAAMTLIAIVEKLDGKSADLHEKNQGRTMPLLIGRGE